MEGVSVGGGAPVEGVSVGGRAPVEGVSVGGGTSEVLLTEKQGIVTVKMDSPKMVPQNYFFENFLELILLQNTSSEHLDHLQEK